LLKTRKKEREGGQNPKRGACACAVTSQLGARLGDEHLLKKLFRRASTPRVRMSSSLLVRASSAVSSAMRNWLLGLIW
jgi:hypothetical protein